MGTWECLFKEKMPVSLGTLGHIYSFGTKMSATIGFKLIWALGYAGGQGKRLLSGAIYKNGLGQLVAHNRGLRHS